MQRLNHTCVSSKTVPQESHFGRPFLAGQAFEPDAIREMSLALETVCAKLEHSLTDDPITRLVASKIIELAQRGVRDAATLSAMTLKDLKHS
jgi:hypothetical protein